MDISAESFIFAWDWGVSIQRGLACPLALTRKPHRMCNFECYCRYPICLLLSPSGICYLSGPVFSACFFGTGMTPSLGCPSASRTCFWRRPASCSTLEPSAHRSPLGATGRRRLAWRALWRPFRGLQVCICQNCWVGHGHGPVRWFGGSQLKGSCGVFPSSILYRQPAPVCKFTSEPGALAPALWSWCVFSGNPLVNG